MASAWGDPTRHYSEPAPRDVGRRAGAATHAPTPLEQRLIEHLIADGAEERVARACKQWNQTLRTLMRSETGLKLSGSDEGRAVPVRVVAGLPRPFNDAFADFDDLTWTIALQRPALEEARDLLKAIAGHYGGIAEVVFRDVKPPAAYDDVAATADFLDAMVKWSNAKRLVDRLAGIETDILGSYFFRRPEIQIYWIAIGVVARVLGISVEDLAVVVLAHELAHAYTHLGSDTDGDRWETESFASADLNMVEGLAQFYTRVACEQIAERYPGPQVAFETLLRRQSAPYTAFAEWAKDHNRQGEIVHFAMIEARSHGLTKYPDFTARLDETAKKLPKMKRKAPRSTVPILP